LDGMCRLQKQNQKSFFKLRYAAVLSTVITLLFYNTLY